MEEPRQGAALVRKNNEKFAVHQAFVVASADEAYKLNVGWNLLCKYP